MELREVARAIASCSEPVRTPFAPACARPPGAAVRAGLPAHVHRTRCQEPLCRWLAALTHCASEITVRSAGLGSHRQKASRSSRAACRTSWRS